MTPIWPPLHRDIDIEQYDLDEAEPFDLMRPPPLPKSRVKPLLVVLAVVVVVAIVWVAT